MSNLLYHAYLPGNHEHHISLEKVKRGGINYSSKSNNRYSNGGRVKLEVTERFRPSDIPEWLNFKEAIGVDLVNRFSKSFCFPIFTDKILCLMVIYLFQSMTKLSMKILKTLMRKL